MKTVRMVRWRALSFVAGSDILLNGVSREWRHPYPPRSPNTRRWVLTSWSSSLWHHSWHHQQLPPFCRVAAPGSPLSSIWSKCCFGATYSFDMFTAGQLFPVDIVTFLSSIGKFAWESPNMNIIRSETDVCVQWDFSPGEMWGGCSTLSVLSEAPGHPARDHLCAVRHHHPTGQSVRRPAGYLTHTHTYTYTHVHTGQFNAVSGIHHKVARLKTVSLKQTSPD